MAKVWSDALRPFEKQGNAIYENRASPEESMPVDLGGIHHARMRDERNKTITNAPHETKLLRANRVLFNDELDIALRTRVAASLDLPMRRSDNEDVNRADLDACA